MHWKDLSAEEGHWGGLELTVARRPTPPAWRLELASPGYLRFICQDSPLLWVRFVPSWQGFWCLSGSGARAEALAPLQEDEVRRVTEPPGSERWYAAWARHFAQALSASPDSPLHEGRWRLLRGHPTPRSGLRASRASGRSMVHGTPHYASQRLAEYVPGPDCYSLREHWGESPSGLLRGLKPPEALSPARIKAWRKRARDGSLPPVLVLFVTSMDGYVVLDGHHRWMAAIEEEVPVPLLTLWPADVSSEAPDITRRENAERLHRERASGHKPISVDALNALALEAWTPRVSVVPSTRVWSLPGRASQWRVEVQDRLDILGPAVDPETRRYLLST